MRITKHNDCSIVELSDGSAWRIWPVDMADTLQWLPTTEVDVRKIDDKNGRTLDRHSVYDADPDRVNFGLGPTVK